VVKFGFLEMTLTRISFIPTEYLALETVKDMAPYAFSPLRPELAGQIKEGDIIVAGKNFGCGSSREQAPEIIKALGD